LPGDETLLSSL